MTNMTDVKMLVNELRMWRSSEVCFRLQHGESHQFYHHAVLKYSVEDPLRKEISSNRQCCGIGFEHLANVQVDRSIRIIDRTRIIANRLYF